MEDIIVHSAMEFNDQWRMGSYMCVTVRTLWEVGEW
jgi:hypothetical protein